jgi:hypothetical protein
MNPTREQRTRRHKAKKSFTLSQESVAFLEGVRKKRRAGSVSAVLEEILQAVRRQQQRSALESAVAGYYDSLSDADVAEQSAWGEFALNEFHSEVV